MGKWKIGRRPKPPELKGQKIGYRVLPVTLNALAAIITITGEGGGEILDRIISQELQRVQKGRNPTGTPEPRSARKRKQA